MASKLAAYNGYSATTSSASSSASMWCTRHKRQHVSSIRKLCCAKPGVPVQLPRRRPAHRVTAPVQDAPPKLQEVSSSPVHRELYVVRDLRKCRSVVHMPPGHSKVACDRRSKSINLSGWADAPPTITRDSVHQATSPGSSLSVAESSHSRSLDKGDVPLATVLDPTAPRTPPPAALRPPVCPAPRGAAAPCAPPARAAA
jgi:hypothetical protein